MNQGYVSTAAPSPADHVKAGAANMSGSVWVVGTGWRHRFLSHCAMLRHLLVTLTTCRGPPRCSPARGHRTLFFRRGPVRCQPSGLLLRAAPRRCSERGRGGCTLRVLGGSTAAAPPRGAACSLACSTAALATMRCCKVPGHPLPPYEPNIYILRYLSLSRLDIHLPSFVLTISQNILA